MKQPFRRAVSALCAFTLAASLVPAVALANGGEEREIPPGIEAVSGCINLDNAEITIGEPIDLATTVENEGIDLLSNEEFKVPLKEGSHEKWIDRVVLEDAVRTSYEKLEEASDNDGFEDYLIEDKYVNGEVLDANNFYVAKDKDGVLYPTILFFSGSYETEQQRAKLEQTMNDYTLIICTAFDRDHPEVFWLGSGISPITYTVGGNQLVCGIVIGGHARSALYPDERTIKKGIADRDAWAENIIAAAPSKQDSEGRIRFFNKWLTENNEYNSTTPLDDIRGSYQDAWECISALEGREGDKGPVCEAYARAFKVLCDRSDIPCVLVDGTAVTSSGSGGHMWNYVSLEGEWYGVDATWNDPRVGGISGKPSGYEHENYLLVGANTQIGNLRFLESHPVTNASFTGYTFPNGPELSSDKYERDCGKMGHVLGEKTIQNEKNPTCEENGGHDEVQVCKYCACKETNHIEEDALGHDMNEWEVIKPATCTEAGEERQRCKRSGCSYDTSRTVPALGHSIKFDKDDIKGATCTEDGTVSGVCSVCGAEGASQVVPGTALGHGWGAWRVATAPTCTVSGVQERICSRDGSHRETRAIPATGHAMGAWQTSRAATCTVPGAEVRRCAHAGCSHTETRAVAATGHAFGAYRPNGDAKVGVNGTETATCSKCGARITRTAAGSALAPAKGQTVTVGGASYTVAGTAAVAYAGPASKAATSATVPATVKVSGRTYKVTSISPKAFAGNKKLKSVKIEANVTAIPAGAFKGCTKLSKVTFGAAVRSVGSKAFYGCKSLKSATLGKNVTSIGASAFQNCAKLTKVTVKSAKLKSIGKSAFAGCKKLKSVSLKTTKLKSVGKNALKGTAKKLAVKVPKSKVRAYQKLFKSKGSKTVRVTK
ncbi:leucine-rich repeat protein [Adlercreutzia caecimuris]|uniref:leucine-rich repeat protein n=2 Tax=Adlercreutzia caecimuris TaxID=671266 RepID=UPI00272CB2D4|nr:leucine-rich repeat protein [Adlercreutzia caecimuris]